MTGYDLPESLDVCGREYQIRTDFRDIINILNAFSDPNLDDAAKAYVFFNALFFDHVPPEDQAEAYKKGFEFINAGLPDSGGPAVRLMDWEQDAPLIISAVNKVAGKEVRSIPHLHWWTFLGYYMEIGESQFSNVVNIRQKKKRNKKLEKYEQEFYRDNKELIDLKEKISDEEFDFLDNLIGWRD